MATQSRSLPLSSSRASLSRRSSALPPLMLVVPGVLIALAMLLPVVYLLVRAAGAGESAWKLLLRERTLQVFLQTALLAGSVTLCSVLIGVPLAWLTVRSDLPLRRFWMVVAALPLVIPSYIGGFTIAAALGPRGMLQRLLAEPLGLTMLPEIYGFPGALLTLTLFSYPYVLLSVRAGLLGLDPAQEEASRSLGQSSWQTFRRITLPQLRPSIMAGALLVALYALSDFGAVSLMQFNSFTRAIYAQYSGSMNRGFAAVLSLALVALTFMILFAEYRARGRSRYYRIGLGCQRDQRLVALRRWRWPAFIFCSLVMALSLVLPLGILLYWLWQGLAHGESLRVVWGSALNSVLISLVAALASVLSALPLALLAVRYPGRVSRWLERSAYMGHALPGLVIALALIFFSINVARPIYQTFVVLVAGYVVLFLPQALGAISSSLLQLSPRLEEAGRGLGRRPLQVLLTVTLPLLRPGLLAGAALVFLTTMKELPATLLLSPIGYQTLATHVWSASTEAQWAQAAAPALLLVLVSSIPMAFLSLGRQRGPQ